MITETSSTQRGKVLDEIIENAIGLPIESQGMLLMMAKAMKYTREYMLRQSAVGQSLNSIDLDKLIP